MANLTFKSIGATTVALNKVGSPNTTTIQYSKNGGSWNNVQFGTTIELDNDTVAFSGNAKFSKNIQNRYYFSTSGKGSLIVSGDLVSLVSSTTIEDDYEFNSLFSGCANLIDAANLIFPSNTTKWCYANMFLDCTILIGTPTLSATTLADWCYSSMFGNCSSLTATPELIATSLTPYCYYCMFYGCSSLTSVPNLPAQNLQSWSYNSMFYDCKNLNSISCNFANWGENATTNWVTEVKDNGIFYKDYSLSTVFGVDNIPSGWSVKYNDYTGIPLTFKSTGNTAVQTNKTGLSYKLNDGNWTAYNFDYIILQDGDEVSFSGTNNTFDDIFRTSGDGTLQVYGSPHSLINWGNLTNNCFRRMFYGCTRIVDASNLALPATTLAPTCYKEMFYSCSSLSSVPELNATSLATNCYGNMFEGCISLKTPPNLPATTLAEGCYMNMFANCYSLTSAPDLPARDLVSNCYDNMFYDCESLNSISVNFIVWSGNCTNGWLRESAPTGTFYKPEDLPPYRGIDYIPEGWTVVNKI